jgi:hypothetical protein
MGQTHRHRSLAAIAIRADGRRMPVRLSDAAEVSLVARLESLVLELAIILTGSRREPGDRRR